MSKKQIKNRKARLKNESEDLAENPVPASASNKTGLIHYLKTHLLLVGIISFLALGAVGAGLKYLDEDAQRELAKRAENKGRVGNEPEPILNKINPFLPAAAPATTPQLSKEYVYAGSRLLAVEDSNASPAPFGDFVVWRPSDGNWYTQRGSDGQQSAHHWGANGDLTAPGDYDGDGKLDFAIWRPSTTPSNSYFWVLRSSDNSYFTAPIGSNNDTPVTADYDGDGKTDLATYTPSTGMWWIYLSGNLQWFTPQFGLSGDVAAPADYTGDGVTDIAVWRPAEKQFYLRTSTGGATTVSFATELGAAASSEPVVADYDGDGRVDFAVRKTGTSDWVIQQSSTGTFQPAITWEQSTDTPVPGDYDGDGKADVAVWRNSNGTWYVRKSGAGGTLQSVQWGLSGDKPIQAYWKR